MVKGIIVVTTPHGAGRYFHCPLCGKKQWAGRPHEAFGLCNQCYYEPLWKFVFNGVLPVTDVLVAHYLKAGIE